MQNFIGKESRQFCTFRFQTLKTFLQLNFQCAWVQNLNSICILLSGAFYCEDEDDDDEFDEYDNFADEDEEHFHNVVDEDETWMAEDSLWWRPDDGDAIDFLEADYPSLLEEQMYRS